MFYVPFKLKVVLLILLSHMVNMVLVLWKVGAILGDRYGIQGQYNVALLYGSGMTAGFHYKNLTLGICFSLITMNIFQWTDC